MEFYSKNDILDLKKECQPFCVPDELFGGMQYKLVRLEVKWAYVACLNVLVNHDLYNDKNQAYMEIDYPAMIDTLAKLANKKVDQEKMAGYIQELEENELLMMADNHIYLQRIGRLF